MKPMRVSPRDVRRRGHPDGAPKSPATVRAALAAVKSRRIAEVIERGYDGHMKRARIAELKNNLSRYLDHVRAGGSVIVVDREQPVAQIVPLRSPRGRPVDDPLTRLERRGLVRRGTGGLPAGIGRRRRPRLRGSVLKDLLQERARGW